MDGDFRVRGIAQKVFPDFREGAKTKRLRAERPEAGVRYEEIRLGYASEETVFTGRAGKDALHVIVNCLPFASPTLTEPIGHGFENNEVGAAICN
jgi:hypothetical protein